MSKEARGGGAVAVRLSSTGASANRGHELKAVGVELGTNAVGSRMLRAMETRAASLSR